MCTAVEHFIPLVEGAAISSMHYIIFFFEAYSTFFSQGVIFRPPTLQLPGHLMSDVFVLESPDMGT